jgi:predicted transcriptional regulator
VTDDDPIAHFATQLDRLMCANSISQRQLYRTSNVHFNCINRVLQGSVDCRISTFFQLVQAAGWEIRITRKPR